MTYRQIRSYGPRMPLTEYDLTGRTALITGAAGGIGRACALLLARAGATVHCADLDEDGLAGTRALVSADGGTARLHPLDVTDDTAVAAVVDSVVRSAGRLDVLAAIAGIMHTAPVLDTADEDLDRVLAVNFKGVLYACRHSARAMIATGTPGSLVTMASGAVDTALSGLFAYSAAKAAVVQLTRTLATELGPHGIRANVVAPGWIRTPMTHRDDPAGHRTAAMARRSPLGRAGEPEDIAHAVLHLASDASAFTTGQIIRPNGGVAMPW
ncbi:SDR family NAD(P)-dependent oxidoreductase [Streptomyces qinzhouensis]|uniref:SDR family oxidoreductase n=1 Tax=Streptomyces qinzhouensis TaxID=2599401 RepID=A0A5B8JNX4_9ACTN|nr:SDR family NAD(P)-dependent oxidoreductase [Streptomyces qinzhouensis]QDY79353.1 SDR family oxidoreductase [Streptomyces qinzhouensis]